jgi:hypothetical protein
LRPEASLSYLKRALSSSAISVWDMDFKVVARFNTFDIMVSGYIGARK